MVKEYLAECPICEKVTALRIQEGHYLKEYPIRINCMNCRALIKGTFVMTNKPSDYNRLYLDNAKQIEITGATKEGLPLGADYIAEISGELPCNLIRLNDGKTYKDTPFMETATLIDNVNQWLNRLEHFNEDIEK